MSILVALVVILLFALQTLVPTVPAHAATLGVDAFVNNMPVTGALCVSLNYKGKVLNSEILSTEIILTGTGVRDGGEVSVIFFNNIERHCSGHPLKRFTFTIQLHHNIIHCDGSTAKNYKCTA